jgi:hypothetical protein
VVLCGYVSSTRPSEDDVSVTVKSAEGLIGDMPFRFNPPSISRLADASGADYWWRLLQYVFDALSDPCLFPPISASLSDRDRSRLDRFVAASEALAMSGVMTEPVGVSVHIDNETGAESVDATFPRVDLQMGFATLLRQCNNDDEAASFARVKDALWALTKNYNDEDSTARFDYLKAWYAAERALRQRSLQKLVRDCLVEREGWSAFDYPEDAQPQQLLSIFNSGDLIHWGDRVDDVLSSQVDEPSAAKQRNDFRDAAVGLAHLYIGFGQLVRAATTPREQLLVP